MIGRYMADGIIDAIDVWLQGEQPRDVDAILDLLTRVAPARWPAGGA
jgi:hypothetical protein